MEESFSSLLSRCGLTEESLNKPVQTLHLDRISRLCQEYWRKLPALLGLKAAILVRDIDGSEESNEAKTYSLLFSWKAVMGSDATYSQLINALLNIGCGQDAEEVCTMLKKDLPAKGSKYLGEGLGVVVLKPSCTGCQGSIYCIIISKATNNYQPP